jgi:exodeoxyribonuclease V
MITYDDLSEDQRFAVDEIADWADGSRPSGLLTFSGFAGTGKTTVTSLIARSGVLGRTAFCTYTGKAASVLRKKLAEAGVDLDRHYIGTIHSLIYKPITTPDGAIQGWEPRIELDRDYKTIVVDEASQVTDNMLQDLQRFNVPILAVGDHGQLPPVGGQGTLMLEPQLRLEKIHRQAEGNPIIRMSARIRETGTFDSKLADGKAITFARRPDLPRLIAERYKNVTAAQLNELGIVCYTNSTRVSLNLQIRKARGLMGPPKAGEQVICLKNAAPIYNGMRGVLETDAVNSKTRPWNMTAKIHFPDLGVSPEIHFFPHQFNKPKTFGTFEEAGEAAKREFKSWKEVGMLFDNGTALTCHKSQGSQFTDLILIVERPFKIDPADWKRWAYTALTRASERVTIVT